MERLAGHRSFFADLITATAGVPKKDGRLTTAFASTPRGRFVGPGPWKVFTLAGYIETPSANPAFLYQDVVVGLAPERKINYGAVFKAKKEIPDKMVLIATRLKEQP